MSISLLLGLAAAGGGWYVLHSKPSPPNIPPTTTTAKDKVDTGVTTATDMSNATLSQVEGASFKDNPTNPMDAGGAPIEGTQTGAPVLSPGPSGEQNLTVDNTANPGGTDPSATPVSYAPPDILNGAVGIGAGGSGDSLQNANDGGSFWSGGDSQGSLMAAMFGPSGANGMTDQQISKAYAESGALTGEIF
jgi:hypothetical protein